MLGMGRIRVGGGVRSAESARKWLDLGAEKVVIGTAASEELLSQLPRERVVVALDARDGLVVSNGWRARTGHALLESIRRFRRLAGGFLVTFVEREGLMRGTDLDLAREVVEAAEGTRVTIAGGVTTPEEVAALDDMGADAQVGMALYTGRMTLASAFAAPLRSERADGLWPTVVVDETGISLGLAWSSPASLARAIETRTGVYQSRSRGLWVKGATSGATQELIAVALDCDRDSIRFTVRQKAGFCHTGARTCWGEDVGITRLSRRLESLAADRPDGSNTTRLLQDPGLLAAKLREEAAELARAVGPADVAEEAADLIYFTLVECARAGVGLEEVAAILDRRERQVTRRAMVAKEGR